MKNIGLLTPVPNALTSQQIIQSIKEMGHNPILLNPFETIIHLHQKNVPSLNLDFVIPRITSTAHSFQIVILRNLEFLGIPSLNSWQSIEFSRQKMLAIQIMAKAKIPMPQTYFVSPEIKINQLPIFEYPIIVKPALSFQGKKMVLCSNINELEQALTSLQLENTEFYLQQYHQESFGRDIRCFILGDQIIAAVERKSNDKNFRANVHQGGIMKPIVLTPEEKKIAIDAAKIFNLSLCGVDLIQTNEGPKVLEVNSCPGFTATQEAVKINIAELIVKYCCNLIT